MSAQSLDLRNSTRNRHELLDDVMRLFMDLLIAGGATLSAIEAAAQRAISQAVENTNATVFRELGALQRDCMEVMCKWRREPRFVDCDGEPLPLPQSGSDRSFRSLCQAVRCESEPERVLKALEEFGAVTIDENGAVRSQTPTFLLGHPSGGLLATDGLLKQLEGFLRVVHRNVQSANGNARPRFERACTVAIAAELEPIFDQLVRSRGQEFVDSVDEWLERNACKSSASGRYVELGAGAYFIDLGERSLRSNGG
jgi:hypothetical protein